MTLSPRRQQRRAVCRQLVVGRDSHDSGENVIAHGESKLQGSLTPEQTDGVAEQLGIELVVAKNLAAHLNDHCLVFIQPLNRPVKFDDIYCLLTNPELQRGSLVTGPLILLLDLPSADQRAQFKQLASDG